MNIKSERLKKLEIELEELERWLKLGLTPKRELEGHKAQIANKKTEIEAEKERLRFLKESGAMDDYVPPKRTSHQRQAFPDTASMPDIDTAEDNNVTDAGLDLETDYDAETGADEETDLRTSAGEEDEEKEEKDEDDDTFFGSNRWEGALDPDDDKW